MKITAQMHAYLPPNSATTPQDLHTEKGVRSMQILTSNDKYWSERGYTYVGPAEVTVDVPEIRELVENKVAALREEAAATRAAATARCTEIEGQIQNLLAIEYTPA